MPGRVTLVLGGIRSGKSAFAEELAGRSGEPVLYLATGQAFDDEMEDRIRIHRERRPASWRTLEEPLALSESLNQYFEANSGVGVALLDSVDVWISNLMLAREEEETDATEAIALESLDSTLTLCRQLLTQVVLVSSEVGLSPVSPNHLGRQFQDLLGTVNQRAAAQADEVFLVVSGIPVKIKPPP
ncbi:MAG: bifunctional adenosylcobinamide kinase/adenosylcobinamide-phosphate guanylyltransferase [Chloroflexota bacterium]|nr:bifunctional adenosylcobinamide kinase/adenosylcobinamide-phosphate guanylyltransferase [Chloroflexota bacterium]